MNSVMRQGNNPRRNRGRSGNRRPGGNNQQRSFDSNGPEGRIRGNASQVYEKYLGLARDASAAGDRILAEAFHQHAEHYYRLLNDSTDPENRRQQAERRQQQNGDDQRGEQDGNDSRDAQNRDNRDQDQGGRNQDGDGQSDDDQGREAQGGAETEVRKPRRRKNGHDGDAAAGETNGKKTRRSGGDDTEQGGAAEATEASGDEDVDGLHRAMQRSAGNGRRKSRAKPAAEESSEKGESADSAESSDSDKPAEGGSESAPQ